MEVLAGKLLKSNVYMDAAGKKANFPEQPNQSWTEERMEAGGKAVDEERNSHPLTGMCMWRTSGAVLEFAGGRKGKI